MWSLLHTFNKYSLIYKTYRIKNRYSFLTKDTYEYNGKLIRLRLDITIIKQTDKPSQSFVKSGVMNKENKYELVEYQDSIQKNLTEIIIGEIIIFLNSQWL